MDGHARQTILEYVIARLKSAGSAAGERVFDQPDTRWTAEDLERPLIVARPVSELVVEDTVISQPRAFTREIDLAVMGLARGHDGLTATLNDLAEAIETTLQADETQGGLARSTELKATDFDYDSEGQWPIGAVILTFAITYQYPALEA